MIDVRVLGPVQLTLDGEAPPAQLLWRKNLALLLYLAFSPRGARTREHLMGLLWGDKPESAARHSLRESLRVLRRALGDNALRAAGDVVAINEGVLRLDTHQFTRCEADGGWRQASELVGGEFLEGFGVPDASPFEDWLASERAAWRVRCVSVLANQAECLLATGDASQAAEVAQRARRLDPRSSTVVHIAMRALALAGERAHALDTYHAFATGLSEVGLTPERGLTELARRVKSERELRLAASVPRSVTQGAELKRPPLIGRQDALAQLLDGWRRCVGGNRAAIGFVVGEAGMGKTRLAEELVARARLEGAATVTLRAVEGDRTTPESGLYALARGGLLTAGGVPAAPPAALAAFAEAVPEWADRFRTVSVNPKPLGLALGDVLRAAADEQPVLIVVDDAHWLDHESLLALIAGCRTAADAPVFFCLCVAPQHPRAELDELRAHMGRDLPGVVLTLGPLEDSAIRQLVSWALPQYGDGEQDRLTRRLTADSAGIPLLAVELLHAVALGLDLGRVDGAWPTPLKTLDQTLPGELPDAIVAAIRVSFRRLSKDAQRALSTAAVLGDRVTVEEIAMGSELQGAVLTTALDELEWQRWLAAEPRGFSFVARVVREVVARDMLTPGQRERIRSRIQPVRDLTPN